MSMETDGPTDDTRKEGPPRGTDRWKKETKAIERVIDVVLTLDTPQTAGWIGEEAMVSEQTAREHLELLADLSVVAATTARGVTNYQADAAYLRFKDVSGLVERYSRDEMMEHVETLKSRIEDTREQFDVSSPDELRSKAASEETPIEEIQTCRKAASEWEGLRHQLDIFKEALQRYDEYDRATAKV